MSFPAEIVENSTDLPDFTKIKNSPKFTQDNESDSLVLKRLGKLKALRNFAFSEHPSRLETFVFIAIRNSVLKHADTIITKVSALGKT